jgi:hypothetical protein
MATAILLKSDSDDREPDHRNCAGRTQCADCLMALVAAWAFFAKRA